MRLERVLCVGGKSHAQLVTLEGVHMMKKNYDVNGESYVLERVPFNREVYYFLHVPVFGCYQSLEIIFANKLGELNGKA